MKKNPENGRQIEKINELKLILPIKDTDLRKEKKYLIL